MRGLLSLVIILVLLVPLAGWWFIKRPLGQLDGVISLPQLSGRVKVDFDSRAVPYVEAGCLSDLYFAQGFLTARDRLFQMDMLRRAAEGKLSQVFGPSCLGQDKLARTIGFGRLGSQAVSQLTEPAKTMLQSYCQGVNAYINSNDDKLPLEFSLLVYKPEQWQTVDTLAVLKYLSYFDDESWRLDDLRQRIFDKLGSKKYAQLFAEDLTASPPTAAGIALPSNLSRKLAELARIQCRLADPAPTWGSTAWVVSGKYTDSGGAILSLSKDGPLTSPDKWYLISLAAPGFHVCGATVPGVPGVMIGRNDHIAWGSAGWKADVQDLVLEEFSPQFPDKYRAAGTWQNAGQITEEIPVRFAADVMHNVTLTSHGPLLLKEGSKGIALSWTGSSSSGSAVDAVRLLNCASNWQDFQQAIKAYSGAAMLFLYADKQGNIGYQAGGDLPVRTAASDGTRLSIGWQVQQAAKVPFADLPSAYNPHEGYFIAANQKIAASNLTPGHQWCPPYRAWRLKTCLDDMIARRQKIALPDCNVWLSDQASYLSPLVKREINQAVSSTLEIDRYQLAALDLLKHWDGTLKPGSAAAAIYESFLQTLAGRLLVSRLGPDLAAEYLRRWASWPLFIESFLNGKRQDWLPAEERTYQTFILTTFSQAVNNLRLALRNDDARQWSWQAVHKATFKNMIGIALPWLAPLVNVGPVGLGGDADTINALDITGDTTGGQFACRSGPNMRLLVDCLEQSRLYQSLSLGQCGHMLAPGATDQEPAWLTVDPMPLAFSGKQLDRMSQHRLILSSEPSGDSSNLK